jgi:hypothetical protein
MEDQTEVIRQQMEGTRTALTEKLVMLEAQVTDKVQQATSSVAETVESVSEAVDNVKESVSETVDAVKNSFDLNWHAEHHPWLLLGGAALLGFVGGRMLRGPDRPRETRRQREYYPPSPPSAPPRLTAEEKPKEQSPGLLDRFSEEVSSLKKIGIGMAMGVLREVVAHAVPNALGPPVAQVINNVTEKLGGQLLGDFKPDDNAGNDNMSHHSKPGDRAGSDDLTQRMSQSGCGEATC